MIQKTRKPVASDACLDSLEPLIQRLKGGDTSAQNEIAKVAYQRMWGTAAQIVGSRNGNPTMGPTALVSEGFLKLLSLDSLDKINDAQHFLSLFARMVRHSLLDYHRKKSAAKRGGGFRRMDLDVLLNHISEQSGDFEALSDALEDLQQRLPRAAAILDMQAFAFMTVDEIRVATGLSKTTVERELRLAKAFVRGQLS